MRAYIVALLSGLTLVFGLPLIASAQGTASDGTTPPPDPTAQGTSQGASQGAATAANSSTPSATTTAQPAPSGSAAANPKPSPAATSTHASGTTSATPGAPAAPASAKIPLAAAPSVPAMAPSATSTPTDSTPWWLWPVIGLLAVIPFGFLAMYFLQKDPGAGEAQNTKNRCFDIEQMMKDKLEELTDLKAMAQDKAVEFGKEAMRDMVSGTKTGDVLVRIERIEREYMRLKKLYTQCVLDVDSYQYKGVLFENSLLNTEVLKHVQILKTRVEGDLILHDIRLGESQIANIQKSIANARWYFHLWEPGHDDVTVVFKDAIYKIKHSDKTTWRDAIAHGVQCGIPESTLDFSIVQ